MEFIQPVILSGGSGTRLWPASRKRHPKQFIDFEGNGPLLGQSITRAVQLPGSVPPMIICNEAHEGFVTSILAEHETLCTGIVKEARVILEPVGRNTCPAIALSAMAALGSNGTSNTEHADAIILVLTADHLIAPQEAFNSTIASAIRAADDGKLVVFGVEPTRAETGYGYIQQGKTLWPGVHGLERFVEKPDPRRAEAMLAEGGYLWNSGMFLFRASVFLRELEQFAPKVHEICSHLWELRTEQGKCIRFPEQEFAACPDISIDYAVMERTKNACVVPLQADWTDIGSWEALYEISAKDENGNARRGDALSLDSRDCLFFSEKKLIAAIGIENLCVIEAGDAVLVMPRNRSQDVKRLLAEIGLRPDLHAYR